MARIDAIRIATIFSVLLIGGGAMAQQPESDTDTRVREGVGQFERGELAAARSTFESILEREPDHVVAIYELAYTHVALGDPERALEILEEAVTRGLDVPGEFYSMAASLLDNLGRKQEAISQFEAGIEAFPENHALHLNLGITLLGLGEFDRARTTFERAVTLEPEHPSAHFFLGQIYAQEGQNAAAILALGTSLGFDNQANRMSAAANIIKSIMDASLSLMDDGTPIVVLPLDAAVNASTLEQFSSRISLHYSTSVVIQRKSDGDLSYEPYAMAYGLIATDFVQSEIDPDSHFAADQYFRFYKPMVDNRHSNTFGHLILAALNPAAASEWVQANGEKIEDFRSWLRTR